MGSFKRRTLGPGVVRLSYDAVETECRHHHKCSLSYLLDNRIIGCKLITYSKRDSLLYFRCTVSFMLTLSYTAAMNRHCDIQETQEPFRNHHCRKLYYFFAHYCTELFKKAL
jgi:hypothetical protein